MMGKIIQNKKLLIIIGLVVVVFFPIILGLLWRGNPESSRTISKGQVTAKREAGATGSGDISSGPTTQPTNVISDNGITPPAGWLKGDNPLYTVNFPSDWKANVISLPIGGTKATFRPKSSPEKELFPNVEIEASRARPENSIVERIKEVSSLGYKGPEISFRDQSAAQLSGVVPNAPALKNIKVYRSYIMFRRYNYIFILSYSYYLDDNKEQNKKLVNDIINTFQPK